MGIPYRGGIGVDDDLRLRAVHLPHAEAEPHHVAEGADTHQPAR